MQSHEKISLLYAAIKEIKKRLKEGDVESSISICGSCEVAMKYGFDSVEFNAYMAIEKARFQ